jgi:hypothetical protein
MPNTHPDNWNLVVSLVLTAAQAVFFVMQAWRLSDAALLFGSLPWLWLTVNSATQLLGWRWGCNEVVLEQAANLCAVLLVVSVLSMLVFTDLSGPWASL